MSIAYYSRLEFRAGRSGPINAFVRGTGVSVASIITDVVLRGQSAEAVAATLTDLSLADVNAAIAFYEDNEEEVHQAMGERGV